MESKFNGLGMGMGNLCRLSDAETRSISAENRTGEKGKGGMAEPWGPISLGRGWKCSPAVGIKAGETYTIADIQGAGAIQHIWVTLGADTNPRLAILRIYWDGQEQPSVECPIGDFFCGGWGRARGKKDNGFSAVNSLAVCVNPAFGFNCYWEMPFRKSCRITLENINVNYREISKNEKNSDGMAVLFYQVDYTLTDVPEDCAYFHAQFRRENPVQLGSVYTILDGVCGRGQYAGTHMLWGVNQSSWWGEGEIKFYMDGDTEWPTICGTGTEDYFCGAWNFDVGENNGGYREFSTPYAGMYQVMRPDGLYLSQQRFGLYRWHIPDPVRFKKELKITIQDLGLSDKFHTGYFHRQDDLASVAFWYQTLPTAPFPALPAKNMLEVI